MSTTAQVKHTNTNPIRAIRMESMLTEIRAGIKKSRRRDRSISLNRLIAQFCSEHYWLSTRGQAQQAINDLVLNNMIALKVGSDSDIRITLM